MLSRHLTKRKVVPKMMRILSVIRDFLPRRCSWLETLRKSAVSSSRFANSKANFNYDIPGFCTNPQTNTLYKSGAAHLRYAAVVARHGFALPVYRLLPYTASTRLFREICGALLTF